MNYGRVNVEVLAYLIPALNEVELSTSRLGKSPQHGLLKMLRGSENKSGKCEIPLYLLRIEPRFLGRSVSSSIEWKIITL
jgi:hypothetical protein